MTRETMVNAFDPKAAADLDERTAALIGRRRELLGPMYRLLYKEPIHVVGASGVSIYGANGEIFLDAYNNVPSIGHSHPRVTEAVTRQLGMFNTHTRYLYDNVLAYAEELLALFPAELAHVMFTCSGSESVDLAMRIARKKTGKQGIIVSEHAYHGNSTATSAASPSSGPGVPVGADIRTVPAPSAASDSNATSQEFCAAIEAAIDDLERQGIGFAAVLFDTIFSSDGLRPGPQGLLKDVSELVKRRGGVFIADEVQPGFARLGTHMWGFARHDFVPDLVALGKPMGNGLPIGGVVARAEMVEEFGDVARYFNTFGGNPVCVAAAQVVLDVIRDEGLQDNALQVGRHLEAGFAAIGKRHAGIAAIRGGGLYWGVEFRDPVTKAPDGDTAIGVVNGLRTRQILISASAKDGNVLKIRPPLCFSRENADRLLEETDTVLSTLSA